MTGTKSIKSGRPDKPSKDFPLFAHRSGQWAKKVKGKLYYFGVWADPDAALRRWNRQKDDLLAGRKPRPVDLTDEGVSVSEACNQFLHQKELLVASGELAKRSFDDYFRTSQRITRVFGRNRLVADLRPDDFADLRKDMTKTLGPVAVGNEVNRTRSVFKYAYEAELIERPVRFGPTFKRPSAKSVRIERAKVGKRLYTPKQLASLMDSASLSMRCMMLLAANCGLGNSDVAQMQEWHADLETGWLDFPRPKTGIERRAKLWPETIAALRAVLDCRPVAKKEEDAGLVFVTKYGKSWHKDTPDNPISKEFRKLSDNADVYRRGLTFYSIRHTFATVAGETGDQVAVNAIMGHVDPTMPARYREHISDERLEAVANHVHDWLFKAEELTDE